MEKYPTIRFIDNTEFNHANNISSLIHAVDLIDRCYICEADLYITNPEIINKYEFRPNYLGAKVTETDDWCFSKRSGYAFEYRMGGTDCYQAFGGSYWNGEDSEKLKGDLWKVYAMRGGKENLWAQVPLRIMKKYYKLEIRKCHKSDIIESDHFIELTLWIRVMRVIPDTRIIKTISQGHSPKLCSPDKILLRLFRLK